MIYGRKDNWSALLELLPAWEELSIDQREFLLDAPTQGAIDQDGIDVVSLIDAGFLERYVRTDRVRISGPGSRALSLLRYLDGVSSGSHGLDLVEYATALLLRRERDGLVSPWSERFDHEALRMCLEPSYVQSFLDARNLRGWEDERAEVTEWNHAAPTHYFEDEEVGKNARVLVRALVMRLDAVPVRTLVAELAAETKTKKISRENFPAAIEAVLRYLLAFARLDHESRPVIGIWPEVAELLRRDTPGVPKAIDSGGIDWFDRPFEVNDLEQVVVRAVEPLRIKSDGNGLYAKDLEALSAALSPLPAAIEPVFGFDHQPNLRAQFAGFLAREMGLLGSADDNRKRLEVTEAGREWLQSSTVDRLRAHIDRLLSPETPLESSTRDRDDEGPIQFVHLVQSWSSVDLWKVSEELTEAFASLPTGEVFLMYDFLRYRSEVDNPLIAKDIQPRYRARRGQLELEREWMGAISDVARRLVGCGAIRMGMRNDGELVFGATIIADYLFRRSDTLEVVTQAEGGSPIRVQPDFEVVFVEPSPFVEASIAPFAERIGQGVGAVFPLTPDSIRQAARAGLEPEGIVGTLEDANGAALPDNVRSEIESWHSSTVQLAFESVLVVRCPDEETAAKVRSAGGAKLELVGDRTLVLADPKERSKVQRACSKKGVFIESEPAPPKKPARRRRRSRRWS